jgi:hypothetical protein
MLGDKAGLSRDYEFAVTHRTEAMRNRAELPRKIERAETSKNAKMRVKRTIVTVLTRDHS